MSKRRSLAENPNTEENIPNLKRALTKNVPKRFLALEYALEGYSADQVARRFGYLDADSAQKAIYKALGGLEALADVSDLRNKEVRKCEKIQRIAWQAFRRSTEPESRNGKKRPTSPGNAAWLKLILDAMKRQADLQGLDAIVAKQTQGNNVNIQVQGMSDEQLLVIAAKHATGFGSSQGAIEAQSSPVEPDGVHEVYLPRLSSPLASPTDSREAGRSNGQCHAEEAVLPAD